MAERPTEPASEQGFASHNGWDREYEVFHDFDLPTYVGLSTFMKLPWVTDPDELRARGADVAIVEEGTPGHSILFRDAAATPQADRTTLLAATLVAQVAYELFADPALVEAAWAEFRAK